MNRRKKEADQHKGWNISISGVFIAMVMGIVLISVVAATLIFVQIYRNAMEQSAVTSSSQSCEQVQNTVENYTQDMRKGSWRECVMRIIILRNISRIW